MIFLTVDEVIELHQKLIDKTGGTAGLRDRNLLESAMASAFTGLDDVEKYPSVDEKAARLAYAVTNNHAFVDGNKRIGIYVMLLTLQLNSIILSFSQEELIALGLGIADGSLQYEDVLDWIRVHS